MLEHTTTRLNAMIDPVLKVWHGEVALDLFLGGIVAGLLILTALRRLRSGAEAPSPHLGLTPWAVLPLVALMMLSLFADLENKLNAWRFYLVLRPMTPMSWGAWLIPLTLPVVAIFACADMPPRLRAAALRLAPPLRPLARLSEARPAACAWIQLSLGLALGLYTGVLLSVFTARPLWNSMLIGPLFLASGLVSAAALMLLVRCSERERAWLGRSLVVLIGAKAMILLMWGVGLATGSEAGQQALRWITGGPYTTAFWTMIVAIGLAAPLAGAFYDRRWGRFPGRAFAVLALVGAFSLRWILLQAGQEIGWLPLD